MAGGVMPDQETRDKGTSCDVTLSENGKAVLVPCPGCKHPRALRLNIMTPTDGARWRATSGLTELTAANAPPGLRKTLMDGEAVRAGKYIAVPWVQCVTCGHDGHYVIESDDV